MVKKQENDKINIKYIALIVIIFIVVLLIILSFLSINRNKASDELQGSELNSIFSPILNSLFGGAENLYSKAGETRRAYGETCGYGIGECKDCLICKKKRLKALFFTGTVNPLTGINWCGQCQYITNNRMGELNAFKDFMNTQASGFEEVLVKDEEESWDSKYNIYRTYAHLQGVPTLIVIDLDKPVNVRMQIPNIDPTAPPQYTNKQANEIVCGPVSGGQMSFDSIKSCVQQQAGICKIDTEASQTHKPCTINSQQGTCQNGVCVPSAPRCTESFECPLEHTAGACDINGDICINGRCEKDKPCNSGNPPNPLNGGCSQYDYDKKICNLGYLYHATGKFYCNDNKCLGTKTITAFPCDHGCVVNTDKCN